MCGVLYDMCVLCGSVLSMVGVCVCWSLSVYGGKVHLHSVCMSVCVYTCAHACTVGHICGMYVEVKDTCMVCGGVYTCVFSPGF